MFIYRLENEDGKGPFSATSISYIDVHGRDIREMLINHLVPEEQGLSHDELSRVKEELIYGKEYHFAWSNSHLICEYIKPDYRDFVDQTGYAIAIYQVPDEHCYILPKDKQVIFDRKYQRKVVVVKYSEFLKMDYYQREALLK